MLSFLAAVFQCLSGVLSKCPVALFPIDCIKTACSVAVEVSTRMVISRPNTSSKDRYAPKTMTAELQVLQDASVDFLCQFCIAQRTFKDASVYQVVNEKIEHLFSIFSLCDEVLFNYVFVYYL